MVVIGTKFAFSAKIILLFWKKLVQLHDIQDPDILRSVMPAAIQHRRTFF